jgi:hypothetical protein
MEMETILNEDEEFFDGCDYDFEEDEFFDEEFNVEDERDEVIKELQRTIADGYEARKVLGRIMELEVI